MQLVTPLLDDLRVLLAAEDTRLDHIVLHVQAAIDAALGRAGRPSLDADQQTWLRNMLRKTLALSDPLFRYAPHFTQRHA